MFINDVCGNIMPHGKAIENQTWDLAINNVHNWYLLLQLTYRQPISWTI